MTCFLCKGTMKAGHTTHMMELPNCILIIKNVPCPICEQCGEVAFESDVIENLDRIAAKLGDVMTEIAVVQYKKSA